MMKMIKKQINSIHNDYRTMINNFEDQIHQNQIQFDQLCKENIQLRKDYDEILIQFDILKNNNFHLEKQIKIFKEREDQIESKYKSTQIELNQVQKLKLETETTMNEMNHILSESERRSQIIINQLENRLLQYEENDSFKSKNTIHENNQFIQHIQEEKKKIKSSNSSNKRRKFKKNQFFI